MNGHALYQLTVFIPRSHAEQVKDALFDAGAGKYQDYDRCSFEIEGTGQFRPGDGSVPYIGECGTVESVTEVRVEMICHAEHKDAVKKALLGAHPYEEPAYYFIPIEI